MDIEEIKKLAIPVLKRQGVLKAAIFGSVARGEMTEKSDIDLLVQLAEDKSLLDLVELKFDLEDNLGRKVDILSYGGINKFLKDIILKEQKIIYESKKGS